MQTYPFKHAPKKDGFCVSASLANLWDAPHLIATQETIGFENGMFSSEMAYYFGFYTQPIVAGYEFNLDVFKSIIAGAQKVAKDAYICISLFTSPIPAETVTVAHFSLLLVSANNVITIDMLDGNTRVLDYPCAENIFAQKLAGRAGGIAMQYDIAARDVKLYKAAELQHLLTTNHFKAIHDSKSIFAKLASDASEDIAKV
jgi:hypothetical protein